MTTHSSTGCTVSTVCRPIISEKNFNSLQSYVRAIRVKTWKRQNGFGAILLRVEFQTGPYKTSHSKYLKNITVGLYPKQNFIVDTFTRCQAKLSESRFRVLTHIALTQHCKLW